MVNDNINSNDSDWKEDLDNLLDDFIDSQNEPVCKEEEDDDSDDSDDLLEVDDNEPAEVSVVTLERAYVPEGEQAEVYTRRDVFRYSPTHRLHIKVNLYNPYYRKVYFKEAKGTACIVDKDNNIVDKKEWSAGLIDYQACTPFVVAFDKPLPCAGEYGVEIRDLAGKCVHSIGIQALDLPAPYTSCFSFVNFGLYKVEKGESLDYSNLGNSHKAFNIKNLKSVLIRLTLDDCLHTGVYDAEFEIKLYNETGQLLRHFCHDAFWYNTDNAILSLDWELGEIEGDVWKKQTYLIEILFMEETVVSASFDVGTKDVEAIYQKDAVQPKTNIAGKTIVKAEMVESPIEKLDAMIGLTSVKEQVHRYRNMVDMARKRAARGLPSVMPPLHAAFMGRPGTGKTTVAKIFGAILKEMGVLSKGHVVFEERSTLTGQFYNSEQEKTLKALERAKGGILFIDEAYTLYRPEDPKDPGIQVLETLLTALSDSGNRDWMLLLAGYSEPMSEMLMKNPGLDSRIPAQNRYYFDDYNVEELMQIADYFCEANSYVMTPNAREALKLKVKRDYAVRDESFGNGRYIENLISLDVLQSMSDRLSKIKMPTAVQLSTIEVEDVPRIEVKDYRKSLAQLKHMVGLTELKKSIESHLNMVRFASMRSEAGIHTQLPPLHMIFTGNPGTGKTTVADLIGEIYYSLGLLSVGNVIRVDRSDLVGVHVGETERKTKGILKQAKGNVLFIDEAYNLYSDDARDFGRNALETLLVALSKEETDMLVIMAGYPNEMNVMLDNINPGLRSRFPYTFHFNDYSVDELIEIAKSVAAKSKYIFSPAALSALKKLIAYELEHKKQNFGNARFVTRLISSVIIPAMGNRLAALPAHKIKGKKMLQTIHKNDIPQKLNSSGCEEADEFDEKAIEKVLKKLNNLVGLDSVKQSINNFVDIARYLQKEGRLYENMDLLRWNFTGNTGTGKSTVASMLGELLKAMNLLGKGHLVEVRAESLYQSSEYKADEILQAAVGKSQQGLLFVDVDAPQFKNPNAYFNNEKLRIKLGTLMTEMPGPHALVFAGYESSRQELISNLQKNGIPDFDHTLHFADYSEDELFRILQLRLKRRKFILEDCNVNNTCPDGVACNEAVGEAAAIIKRYIAGLCSRRDLGYANARTMKLISRTIENNYLLRASRSNKPLGGIVTAEDVAGFVWNEVSQPRRIGYKG